MNPANAIESPALQPGLEMAVEVSGLSLRQTSGEQVVAGGETQAHRDLKRLALLWAQTNGFRIAAAEVSLPNHRVRMDVAAYQTQRVREVRRGRVVSKSRVGATAIFECKASKTDFVRDARSRKATRERLERLDAKRVQVEDELKIHYPSIRNGDSLFQEYETLNFERPGYERYEKIIAEIRQLSARLHRNTKFDRLAQFGAANLFYVVAEPDVVAPGSLPCGWGWLERAGNALVLKTKPHWHDVAEEDRLAFLQRVALAGTRCVNREHAVEFTGWSSGADTRSPQAFGKILGSSRDSHE